MSEVSAVSPSSSVPSRLPGIDALRAIAATAVVVTHLPFSLQGGLERAENAQSVLPEWIVATTRYGAYGVHLFLVISGFCIHMQWARRPNHTGAVGFYTFWKRRLRRLYPPYASALVASLLGLAIIVHLAGGSSGGFGALFGYSNETQFFTDLALLVLLAQNLNGASGRVGNGPFWSLALEEQLYMLYFPLLAVRRRWGWPVAVSMVAIVTLVWRGWFAFGENVPNYWYVVGPARWLEWTLGALAVEAHLGRVRLPTWLASPFTVALASAGAIALVPPANLYLVPGARLVDDIAFAFAAFVLVNWVCRLDREGRISRSMIGAALARLGVMSYSLYLVHDPVMVVTKRLALQAGVHSLLLLAILRFGAAIAAAFVFFWFIERHFLRARTSEREKVVPTVSSQRVA